MTDADLPASHQWPGDHVLLNGIASVVKLVSVTPGLPVAITAKPDDGRATFLDIRLPADTMVCRVAGATKAAPIAGQLAL